MLVSASQTQASESWVSELVVINRSVVCCGMLANAASRSQRVS